MESIGVLLGLALLIVLALQDTNIPIASIVSAQVGALTNGLGTATARGRDFTGAMTALHGSPPIRNAISAHNLGTTPAAAPALGLEFF